MVIVHPARVIAHGAEARVEADIELNGRRQALWYSVQREYEQYLSPSQLDPFVLGILLLAMKHGQDVSVRGAMSEKLLFNLTHFYIPILRLVMPYLKKVSACPDSLSRGGPCANGVVTGFSAGVDSFCVLHDHFFHSDRFPGYKVSHLVFSNVGSHGEHRHDEARALFNARYDLLKDYPASIGLKLVKIDSNLSEHLNWDFDQTHTIRNVAAVMVLQSLFSKYLFASGYRYQDCFTGPTTSMAYSDPVAVHLLSTENTECISTGCQYSRVEKTRLIGGIEGPSRLLNVCVSLHARGHNCSACYKCQRTLFTLDMLGQLDKYAAVFDLEAWRKTRRRYITRQLLTCKKDTLMLELLEYARENGYPFSLAQRVEARARRLCSPWVRRVRKVLTSFKRRAPRVRP